MVLSGGARVRKMSMSRGLGTSRVNLGCWGGEQKFGGSSQVTLVRVRASQKNGVGADRKPA